MSARRILTIGLELASPDTRYESFVSKTSLLDWDIVLFKPVIDDVMNHVDYYHGKPNLTDSASFRLRECCEHWRREIKQAAENGKTVIAFLPRLQEVHVDTGHQPYSGTGRNQKTTRHVQEYSNYETMPVSLLPAKATGNSMKLSPRGANVLAPYWAEFESVSQYKVVLTDPKVPACLVTKTGDKAVGALYRSKSSAGTLLFLPDIDFYPDHFVIEKATNEVGMTPPCNSPGAWCQPL